MNRALETGTNLRNAKKNMMTNMQQIGQVLAMNSFCLYLKISVLSFMNKALKIQPSIYWGRLPCSTPPGTSCSVNCIYHPVNVLVNFSTFLSDGHVNFLIREKNTILRILSLSYCSKKVYFPI